MAMTSEEIEEARQRVLSINKRLAAVAVEMETIQQMLAQASIDARRMTEGDDNAES